MKLSLAVAYMLFTVKALNDFFGKVSSLMVYGFISHDKGKKKGNVASDNAQNYFLSISRRRSKRASTHGRQAS